MLLSENESTEVWERVYRRLQFTPSVDISVIPFELPEPWAVYDISDAFGGDDDPFLPEEWNSMTEQFTDVINRILLSCMVPGERLYALDWQHSGFLFDPQNREEQQDLFVEDERYWGGGYYAYSLLIYRTVTIIFSFHRIFGLAIWVTHGGRRSGCLEKNWWMRFRRR